MRILVAIALLTLAPACGIVAGLSDNEIAGHPGRGVKANAASVDGGDVDGGGTAPGTESDGGMVDDGAADDGWNQGPPVAVPKGCPDRPEDQASDTLGVFVSRNGSDNSTTCDRTSPCKSIQGGIDRASSTGKTIVYVDSGEYDEAITLKANIRVQGGWTFAGTTVTRQCTPTRATSVAIKSRVWQNGQPAQVAVRASGLGAALDTLTVTAWPWNNLVFPGQSFIGILVTQDVTLQDVEVHVHQGVSGIPGADGDNGCQSRGNPDGKAGVPGTIAAPKFQSDGIQNVRAGSGQNGNPGGGATPGKTVTTCTTCASAAGDSGMACTPSATKTVQGDPSSPGCGGSGGEGGYAGGSSIALYIWSGTVTMSGGLLEARVAGDGGNGGAGKPGQNGTPGNDKTCNDSCDTACHATCSEGSGGCRVAGGTVSGAQNGGAGGAGAGGAGGLSYAVYTNPGGILTQVPMTTTAFAHEKGGQGGLDGKGNASGTPGGSGDMGPP